MADNSSDQERTEDATPKRLRDAKQRGQIARSRELNTMMMMLSGAIGLMVLGERMAVDLISLVRDGLHLDRAELLDRSTILEAMPAGILNMLAILTPFLVLMVVAALVGPLLMGGWAFSGEALHFKLNRLDPIGGIKRILGWKSIMELVKALAKFALLAGVSCMMFSLFSQEFMHLGLQPLNQGIIHGAQLFMWIFLALASALAFVAAADVPFQLWDHARNLKMTRQEVKDELKETEGNPEIRGRIRAVQREVAQRRMMEAVPDADVVVVNPTHYAVALRYEEDTEGAPKVVAKGTDMMALKIREVATRHGVPIYSAPPLARALHHTTEIDNTIPAGLYVAVAQVLAYVYQVKNVDRQGGAMPERPDQLPVPEEFLKEDK